jgi:hypothetical protein
MRREILSGLSGLALLSSCFAVGCGEGSLGRMLTSEVPHKPYVTHPLLVTEMSAAAIKELEEYKKDSKIEHIENAYHLFLDTGNTENALDCAKIVLSKPEYINMGRLMMRGLQDEMPSENKK